MKIGKKLKAIKIASVVQGCILYFIWSSLIVAMCFAIYRSDWTALFIALVTLGLTFLPYTLEYYEITLPKSFSLAIIFFLYATLFLGEGGGFY
jgi:hypothetical protein